MQSFIMRSLHKAVCNKKDEKGAVCESYQLFVYSPIVRKKIQFFLNDF